jgi:hypothetical protein
MLHQHPTHSPGSDIDNAKRHPGVVCKQSNDTPDTLVCLYGYAMAAEVAMPILPP